MDVLIVGGTRFVGYQLAWRLIARGDRVTLLNRGTRADPFGDRVARLVADRASKAFDEALAGKTFDACVDFATYTGEEARGGVEALDGKIGHYVMISTGQVYLVRVGCPKPAKERDYEGAVMEEPADPAEHEEWAYGVGKREAEEVLARAWEERKFPSTRLRIPMVNGERDHYRRLEGYAWRMLDGGPLVLPGGGGHRVRHVYGGSVVKAIVDNLGNARAFGRAYNLAQEETPTFDELLRIFAAKLGTEARTVDVPVEAVVAAGLDPLGVSAFSGSWMSFLDPSLVKAELGFEHEPLDGYLDKVAACLINFPPEGYPDSYAKRPAEIRLAQAYLG